MPQTFKLSEFVNQNIDLPPIHINSGKSKNHAYKAQEKYKRKVWASFTFAFCSSLILSAVIIDQSKVAVFIMNRVRANNKISAPAQKVNDLSSLSITTSPGLVAMITAPDNKKSGEDNQKVRFYEITNTSITNDINLDKKPWSLFLQRPSSGIYQIDFTSQISNIYTFSIASYDQFGQNPSQYNYKTRVNPGEILRYHLVFDKLEPSNTKLLDVQTLPQINN
jgi:hypothetical protein